MAGVTSAFVKIIKTLFWQEALTFAISKIFLKK